MKWMSIDTAPRDGTAVIVRSQGNRICIASHRDTPFIGNGWHVSVPCAGGWASGTDTYIQWAEDQPTHWMPVPEFSII